MVAEGNVGLGARCWRCAQRGGERREGQGPAVSPPARLPSTLAFALPCAVCPSLRAAFGLVAGAGLATTLGACIVWCASLAQPRLLAGSLGFAAGVML